MRNKTFYLEEQALVGQRFDERRAAQAKAKSKQLKFMAEKTKVMSEYALSVIDAIDEQARTTSELGKAVAAK